MPRLKRSARTEIPFVLAVTMVLLLVAFAITFPDSTLGDLLGRISFGLLP